jgi:hypothetical protein
MLLAVPASIKGTLRIHLTCRSFLGTWKAAVHCWPILCIKTIKCYASVDMHLLQASRRWVAP